MTEAIQLLGVWNEMPSQPRPSSRMVLDADHLAHYWRRVSLTADFWAHYLSLSVPTAMSQERLNREAMYGILSYLLNELFENCAKFSAGAIKTVLFHSWRVDDHMVFQITNHIKSETQESFANFLQDLLAGDPHELYFKRIEENAETGHSGSGLGYLTLMMDYGISFGFRFRPSGGESIAVDVQARVSMTRDDS
jgi:hypothetical protein